MEQGYKRPGSALLTVTEDYFDVNCLRLSAK